VISPFVHVYLDYVFAKCKIDLKYPDEGRKRDFVFYLLGRVRSAEGARFLGLKPKLSGKRIAAGRDSEPLANWIPWLCDRGSLFVQEAFRCPSA